MGTATGFTAVRMEAIENASVVDGEVIGDDLHLYTFGGGDINAGDVRGPVGPSAANPVPWSSLTAYTSGAIVGYAGVLWKCSADNTNHPPHLYSTEWTPIEGFDYTSNWAQRDAYFTANDFHVGWEDFWKTGTATAALTSTAGEFETGDQALKIVMSTASKQVLHTKGEENIVRGGEVINVLVRAKLRVAAAGVTFQAGMWQNDATGLPGPFATGLSVTGANEGALVLTTAWTTFVFTINAVNGKSRAVPYLEAYTTGAAADVLIDRIEISRNKSLNLNPMNVRVGTIVAWPSDTIPEGWLLCGGNASRVAYPELFALIGVTYGAGDGSTTFGLPNMVGRHPMGKYPGGPYAASLGATGGEASHVLTTGEMPNHTHPQNVLAGGVAGTGQRLDYAGDRAFAGTFDQGVSTQGTGGGAAHNVLDPYTTVNYIIRAIPSALVDSSTLQFFKGAVAANGAVAFAANTNMPFTVRTDPSNAWNATTSLWTCPQPGRYRIKIAWKANATAAARSIRIIKNGSAIAQGPLEANAASAGGYFEDVLDLIPGDTISVQPTVLYTTMQDGAGIENNWLIIESVGLAGAPATGWSDTGWVNMQLINSWVNYDSGLSIGGSGRVCRVRKLNGVVFVEGVIKTGTNGTIAFQLPAAYRPGITTIYERADQVQMAGGPGYVSVDASTGNVAITGPSSSSYSYVTACWIAAS